MKRALVGLATTVLVSSGLGLAGLGLAGTANASPIGPEHWCPGQPMTGYLNGVVWDTGHCHTWWVVEHGLGNVETGNHQNRIWDGDNPPADTPPPGMPPFLCRSEFPPQTCVGWGM